MGVRLITSPPTYMNAYELNTKLASTYGHDIGIGLPKFRIVWSTTQLEKRYGEYEVYSESGDIYLRTEKGVEEVQKYLPDYPDMWVLEELRDTIGNPYLSMVTKFSYEPLWIFGAANSDRNPIWKAVELLIKNRLFGDPNRVNMSPADLIDEEERQMAKERENARDFLRNETPALAFSIKHGSSIVVPGMDFQVDSITNTVGEN